MLWRREAGREPASQLIRRIEERNYYFSAGQFGDIQSALAQEAVRSGGILGGNASNRGALAARTKVHALRRLECMGR